jgi:hypothetical protein
MTWAIWAWTVFFAVLLIAWSATVGSTKNNCNAACWGKVGGGVGASLHPILIIWLIVFLNLSIVCFTTRPQRRSCPHCGHDVRKGPTACKSCGYDSTTSTVSGRPG